MFYVIKSNKVFECGDTINAGWQYPDEAKTLAGETLATYLSHTNKYIVSNDELVLNPNYETEETAKRRANFEKEFLTLATNKNYRLQPKGYANAQQSIDTVNNMVNVAGSLTEQIATMILFYQTPDFSDETQCTDEWLIQHQFSAEPMTLAEWQAFYVDFTTKYAQKMYQQQLLEAQNEAD